LPVPPFSVIDLGVAPVGSTNRFSIQMLITKALPVTRWQSRQ
jgi:hypothetical protein